MEVEKMRAAIDSVYDGPVWKKRVALMPERQVVAVYKTMERSGRLIKKKKRKSNGKYMGHEYRQMCMFDDPSIFNKRDVDSQ